MLFCRCDKDNALTIYQKIGNYEDPNMILGMYCGKNLPPMLMSVENEMEIVFHNYMYKNQYGFQASYAFVTGNCTNYILLFSNVI